MNDLQYRLDGLTAIRFVAAAWVFVFHFDIRVPLNLPISISRVVENGALAMPIFFMLSGFVLGHRYRDRYYGFSAFIRARVARIYPAYILGVVLCLPFFFSGPTADVATSFLLIPIDLLLLQSWYPNLWSFWHHAGTWSISVEFFLYAAFPLMLALNGLSSRELVVACCASILLSSSWIPSLGVGASSDLPFPIFYSVPIYSLPIFLIGVALAELHRRGFRGSILAPVFLFAILAFVGHKNSRYAGLNFVTLPLIALTLLFAARGTNNTISRLFVNRVTIYLGDISYGIFVYQIPLLLALDHYIHLSRTLPVWQVAAPMLLCNIGLAAASHRWLEPWGSRLIVKHWGAAGRDESIQVAIRPATDVCDETIAHARASR